MSTIQKETAEELAANEGRCGDDPQAYAIIEFESAWDGSVQYALCYSVKELRRYTDEHKILRYMWHLGLRGICPNCGGDTKDGVCGPCFEATGFGGGGHE